MWFTKLAISCLCLPLFIHAVLAASTHDLSTQSEATNEGEFQTLGCPKTTRPCATTQEQLYAVTSYYNTLFSGNYTVALTTWTAKNFIQHAPNVTDGQAAAKQAFAEQALVSNSTQPRAQIQNIFVGKNATAVDFAYVFFKGLMGPSGVVAVMESWRLSGDCLIEHWVVVQQASGVNSTNPKAFF